MKRPVEDTLSLLAGAGLGVAMMYLFDPASGRQRRQRLTETAKDTLSSAGETASSAFHNLSARAMDLAENLRGSGGDWGDDGSSREWSSRAANAAQGLADSARDMAGASGAAGLFSTARRKLSHLGQSVSERVSGSASDAYQSARDTKRRWVRSAADAIGAEREHHYLGQTACALGSLALGAGLIWAFDPRLGRSRRAWLADKTGRFTRETGDFFRRTGKFAAGRLRGTVAGTRGYARSRWRGGGEPIDDQTLCARVRSELGRVVQNMHGLEVQATDGYVVLLGEAEGSELESATNLVLEMRGVRGLDNRLRARGTGNASTIGWAPIAKSAGESTSPQSASPQSSSPVPSRSAL
jgi:gas vesicle protein